jgi:hypothetical protein
MGDLIAIFVEQGDIQQVLEFLVVVIPDIGLGPGRFQKAVSLFPNPDRMGLDP